MIRIRPATSNDAKAIAGIYVRTWRSIYAGLIPDSVLTGMSVQRQAVMWGRRLDRASGMTVLVAEVDDDVAGFIGVGSARQQPSGVRGEVQTLYVLDDYQGCGAGRALLNAGFRALIERRMNSAVIWVLAGNPSRFFYEAMGGQRIAERQEPLWGAVLHEIAYSWPDLAAHVGRTAGGPSGG